MTLRSMFRGPGSKLVLVCAASLMLSGVPAYADSGGGYGQAPYGYGAPYGNGSCQQPGGWNGWNAGNGCQNGGGYRGTPDQPYRGPRNAPSYQDDRRYGAPQYDNRRYVGPQYNDCQDPNRGGCQPPAPQPNDQRNIHDDGNSK